MATIKFLHRSKKEKANLTLRFRHYQKIDSGQTLNFLIEIKTQERVDSKKWNENKEIRRRLEDIEEYILDDFKLKYVTSMTKEQISSFLISSYKKFIDDGGQSNDTLLLVDWMKKEREDLEISGMSYNRIRGVALSTSIVEQYNPFLEVSEVTNNEMASLRDWMVKNRKYALSTAEKVISDARSSCRLARSRGIRLADDFESYSKKSSRSRDKKNEVVIFLTQQELDSIDKLELTDHRLVNARKWLMLGCYTAQRGNDLLQYIVKGNFIETKQGLMIEFTQDKVGEHMRILALPKVEKLYVNNELPTKVFLHDLNKQVKVLCKMAKIDTPIKANLTEEIELPNKEVVHRKVLDTRPKHMYISSHDFRRTFCTLHFGELSNQDIMKFSGHRSEAQLMEYIGKKDHDFSSYKKLYGLE